MAKEQYSLVNLGKYNMTPNQMVSLKGLFGDDVTEQTLDSWPPVRFGKIPGFGIAYVLYVKKLRDVYVPPANEDISSVWDEVAGEEEYVQRPVKFIQLPNGKYDVEVTLTLASHVAQWLDKLLVRLPRAYPDNPECHNLGFVLLHPLLSSMQNDVNRHGPLGGGDAGGGTVSKDDFNMYANTDPKPGASF
jgi:hypothetical protein